MSYLQLNGLRKTFGQGVAVDNVDLEVEKGEFVSLLGPSGCGKTTTLRIVAGLEAADSGTVILGERDITHLDPRRRDMGMVFQSYALFPNMTAGENVAFGLRVRRQDPVEMRETVQRMLELVDLADKQDHYPHQLSGGQRQRIALARALAIEPSVLLLDEPLSALDAVVRVALRDAIRSIQRRVGITTLYVTHDQEEALSLSDRVVVMQAGRIEQTGAPEEIYHRPATPFVASFVGARNVVTGRMASEPGWVEAEASRIRLEVPKESGGTPWTPGRRVEVSFRPEVVGIARRAEEIPKTHNRLAGEVLDKTFSGATIRVHVLCSGLAIRADVAGRGAGNFRRGEAVWAHFAPEDCFVAAFGTDNQ